MTLPNAQSSFCSSRALEVNAPLYGTAGTYGVYLIVEWNHPMEAQVEPQFELQAFADTDDRQRWRDLLESLPQPRLQLVKQRGFSTDEDGLTCYVAIPREVNALLYEFKLKSYRDLLDINVAALMAGDLEYRANLCEDPVYLVCTHGRRDPCCVRRGLPVYNALARYVGKPTVWQTSHLGGHRYASTLLSLPHGVYYGFVGDNEAPVIAEHVAAGRVFLPRYRGRAAYSKITQAAEYYLRQHTGIDHLDAYRLLKSVENADGSHTFAFEDADTHVTAVTIREDASDYRIPSSCSNEEEEHIALYTLIEIKTGSPS